MRYYIIISICLLLIGCKTKEAFKGVSDLPLPSYIIPLSVVGDADWEVDNGIISCDEGEGFFQTNENFQYFDLSVDFKPEGDINSGIFLGCHGRELSATGCYEVNIWDNHPNQDFRTGSIVTRANPISIVDSKGKWNNYMIKVRPGNISVMLNGTLTAYLKVESEITSSPIAFQKFGKGKMSFKNFNIERYEY